MINDLKPEASYFGELSPIKEPKIKKIKPEKVYDTVQKERNTAAHRYGLDTMEISDTSCRVISQPELAWSIRSAITRYSKKSGKRFTTELTETALYIWRTR